MMKRKSSPITPEKLKWAENRSVVLRGNRLNYNVSIQLRYQRSLTKLIRLMAEDVKKEIAKLFKSDVAVEFIEQQQALDASVTSKAKKVLNKLMGKFQSLFDLVSKPLAEEMVDDSQRYSSTTLQTSLKKVSGGLSLNTGVIPAGLEEVSEAVVLENVSLIRSIPAKYFDDISGAVMRSISTGQGLRDLVPEIQKYHGITERRAKLIARDQTRKAYNFINKEKLKSLGMRKFEWIHSGGGQHPRKSHQAMGGNIYSFDDLPQINKDNPKESPVYGIPGQAINCGCTMNPVIEFNQE